MSILVVARVATFHDEEVASTKVEDETYASFARSAVKGAVTRAVSFNCELQELAEAAVDAVRSQGASVLAIEYVESNDPFRLASLCAYLERVLDEIGSDLMLLVVRVESVQSLLNTRLTDLLEGGAKRSGDLKVVVADATKQGELAGRRLRGEVGSLLPDRIGGHVAEPRNITARDLDLTFGHYVVPWTGQITHTNVLPRLDRLVQNPSLVQAISLAATELAGADRFNVSYVGSALLPLQRLALEVAEGDVGRVVEVEDDRRAAPTPPNVVILLTDVIGPMIRPDAAVKALNQRGWADVRVLAVCGHGHSEGTILVRLPPVAGAFSEWACPYCRQGAPLSEEPKHLSTAQYHPKVFWDLLSWDPSFSDVGHWISDVTPNHFNLRILASPLFDLFGRSIAERMRNALVLRGVLPPWIDGIICTTGAESEVLVPEFAELVGVPQERILRIPPEIRGAAAGPGVRDEVRDWVKNDMARIVSDLRFRNVVLIDQAAHHFHTLVALRKVASLIPAKCLAFCVFVDRSGLNNETDGPLEGIHYLPLYEWPSPPSLAGLCPCGNRR